MEISNHIETVLDGDYVNMTFRTTGFMENYQKCRRQGSFADVIIHGLHPCTSDQTLYLAHSLLISSSSPCFRLLLENSFSQKQSFLNYRKRGFVQVLQDGNLFQSTPNYTFSKAENSVTLYMKDCCRLSIEHLHKYAEMSFISEHNLIPVLFTSFVSENGDVHIVVKELNILYIKLLLCTIYNEDFALSKVQIPLFLDLIKKLELSNYEALKYKLKTYVNQRHYSQLDLPVSYLCTSGISAHSPTDGDNSTVRSSENLQCLGTSGSNHALTVENHASSNILQYNQQDNCKSLSDWSRTGLFPLSSCYNHQIQKITIDSWIRQNLVLPAFYQINYVPTVQLPDTLLPSALLHYASTVPTECIKSPIVATTKFGSDLTLHSETESSAIALPPTNVNSFVSASNSLTVSQTKFSLPSVVYSSNLVSHDTAKYENLMIKNTKAAELVAVNHEILYPNNENFTLTVDNGNDEKLPSSIENTKSLELHENCSSVANDETNSSKQDLVPSCSNHLRFHNNTLQNQSQFTNSFSNEISESSSLANVLRPDSENDSVEVYSLQSLSESDSKQNSVCMAQEYYCVNSLNKRNVCDSFKNEENQNFCKDEKDTYLHIADVIKPNITNGQQESSETGADKISILKRKSTDLEECESSGYRVSKKLVRVDSCVYNDISLGAADDIIDVDDSFLLNSKSYPNKDDSFIGCTDNAISVAAGSKTDLTAERESEISQIHVTDSKQQFSGNSQTVLDVNKTTECSLHAESKIDIAACIMCKWSSSSLPDMIEHIKAEHYGKIQSHAPCFDQMCPIKPSLHDFGEHVKHHVLTYPEKCSYCTFSSSTVQGIRAHVSAHKKYSLSKTFGAELVSEAGKMSSCGSVSNEHYRSNSIQYDRVSQGRNKEVCDNGVQSVATERLEKKLKSFHVKNRLHLKDILLTTLLEKLCCGVTKNYRRDPERYFTCLSYVMKFNISPVHLPPLQKGKHPLYTTAKNCAVKRKTQKRSKLETQKKNRNNTVASGNCHGTDVACSLCELTLNSDVRLEDHYYEHHRSSLPFTCPFDNCPVKLKNTHHLYIHLKRHTVKSQYSCPHCSYSCPAVNGIRIHAKGHATLN